MTQSFAKFVEMDDSTVTFEIDSCIRGYHAYGVIWTPTVGEHLSCEREMANTEDPYAVAVMRRSTVVGHVPRRMSAACALFLEREGTISCTVTGSRRFSADLPQGGLEVPCTLKFQGPPKHVAKMKKLVVPDTKKPSSTDHDSKTSMGGEQHNKKRRITSDIVDVDDVLLTGATSAKPWLTMNGIELTEADKVYIIKGAELNDKHINFAQEIIRKQFKNLTGLQSTLALAVHPRPLITPAHPFLQIIHSKGNHWIVASTVLSLPTVQVFDSLYSSVDDMTTRLLTNLFGINVTVEIGLCPQQDGTVDCGVFAIATCAALAHGSQPSRYDQKQMRGHLLKCFENLVLTVFPC